MCAPSSGEIDPPPVSADGEALLALARDFDRQGRAGLALQELRRAADSGHVPALTLLGARLMTGQGAPLSTEEGEGLIVKACDRGDADAACLLATLEGAGAGRPQSWARALDYLQLAAERGSPRARAQFTLLARGAGPQAAAHDEPPRPDLWRRLRENVDLQALTTPAAKRSLSESPRIRVIEAFASAQECDWLTAIARRGLAPALVFDPRTGKGRREQARSNSAVELSLADMDLVVLVLRARISAATNIPLPTFEPTQVLHYAVGQQFDTHYDFLDPAGDGYARELARFGQRIATFLLYLNDGFEGGETAFLSVDLKYKGAKGDAVFFANVNRAGAPDRQTLHAGLPPSQGEKWILSQWIRDRSPGAVPPRPGQPASA